MATRNKIVQSISNMSSIIYHTSEWWETCWLNLRKCSSGSEWTSFWFLYVRKYHYRDETFYKLLATRNEIVQNISNISSISYHISWWWETCWLNFRKYYSVSQWTWFWFLYVRKYHYRDEICDVFVTIGSCEKYWSELIHISNYKTGLEKFSVSGFN